MINLKNITILFFIIAAGIGYCQICSRDAEEVVSKRREIVEAYKETSGAYRDIVVEHEKMSLIQERNQVKIDTTDFPVFRMTFGKVTMENVRLYGESALDKFSLAVVYFMSTKGGTQDVDKILTPPDITDEDKFLSYYKPLNGYTAKQIFKIFNSRPEKYKELFR